MRSESFISVWNKEYCRKMSVTIYGLLSHSILFILFSFFTWRANTQYLDSSYMTTLVCYLTKNKMKFEMNTQQLKTLLTKSTKNTAKLRVESWRTTGLPLTKKKNIKELMECILNTIKLFTKWNIFFCCKYLFPFRIYEFSKRLAQELQCTAVT